MKRIFVSQSEKNMGRNRSQRVLDAILDSRQTKPKRRSEKDLTQNVDNPTSFYMDKTADTQSRGNERVLVNSNHANSTSNLPDITFCPYLTKCPIRKTKRCFFNSKYESCRVNKFYERWGE